MTSAVIVAWMHLPPCIETSQLAYLSTWSLKTTLHIARPSLHSAAFSATNQRVIHCSHKGAKKWNRGDTSNGYIYYPPSPPPPLSLPTSFLSLPIHHSSPSLSVLSDFQARSNRGPQSRIRQRSMRGRVSRIMRPLETVALRNIPKLSSNLKNTGQLSR